MENSLWAEKNIKTDEYLFAVLTATDIQAAEDHVEHIPGTPAVIEDSYY